MMINIKVFEKGTSEPEFMLYEQGSYSKPITILCEYSVKRLFDQALEGLTTDSLKYILNVTRAELGAREPKETNNDH